MRRKPVTWNRHINIKEHIDKENKEYGYVQKR